MSKFGGIAVQEEEALESTSRFGGVSIEDINPEAKTQEQIDADAEWAAQDLMQRTKKDDPSTLEQLYGAARRELEPAAMATLAGAAMGSPFGGVGAGPGALAGLAAYGLSRAAGAVAPIVGLNDPYEALEQFYTDIGVPDPKDESIKTLRTIFQAASTGPVGLAKTSAQKLPQLAASGMAVGAGEAIAFETAAEVAEYLGVDEAALPLGIVAAIMTGKKLSPKDVDGMVETLASKSSGQKRLNLKETAELAKKATTSKSAKKELAKQFTPDESVLKAAQKLEVDEFMSPDLVTTNRAATETAQGIKSYAAGPARTAEFESLEQAGNRFQEILEKYGATQDFAGLSNKIRGEFEAGIKSLEGKSEKLHGQILKELPSKTRGKASRTLGYIEDKLDKVDDKQNQITALERKALGALRPSIDDVTREVIQPTYESMEAVRKEIGKGFKKMGEFKDEDAGLLKKLYGLISEDQMDVLESIDSSTDLVALKRAANQATVKNKELQEQMVELFGKKLDGSVFFKLGKETSGLTKRDANKFKSVLEAIPKHLRQETLLTTMDSTFARHASSGNLNFASFSKWYDKLKSNKTAHNAFMEALTPEARKAVDNIAKVSGSIARAVDKKIYTGRLNDVTDQLKQADNLWGSLAKKALIGAGAEVAAQKLGGAPGAGIASVLTASLMSGKKDRAIDALNKLLIDPEFTMMTRESVKQSPKIKQQLINKMANVEAFVRFARQVNLSTQEERLKFLENSFTAAEEEE